MISVPGARSLCHNVNTRSLSAYMNALFHQFVIAFGFSCCIVREGNSNCGIFCIPIPGNLNVNQVNALFVNLCLSFLKGNEMTLPADMVTHCKYRTCQRIAFSVCFFFKLNALLLLTRLAFMLNSGLTFFDCS